MTREEFVEKARKYRYAESEINEILKECDEIIENAPDCFEFNYDALLLFEQHGEEI